MWAQLHVPDAASLPADRRLEGRVLTQGSTWNQVGAHTDWHRVYVMLKGKGRMFIAREEHAVEAPSVTQIPHDADHAVRVNDGEYVEYVYVNKMLKYEKLLPSSPLKYFG